MCGFSPSKSCFVKARHSLRVQLCVVRFVGKMYTLNKFVVYLVVIGAANAQRYAGEECTLQSTGSSGVCKLLNDCSVALEDLQKNKRIPQTCGFQGTQPIVCCPGESEPEREPGVISRRKCREYSKYVSEKTVSPVLSLNAQQLTTNKCGHKVVKLIVGGEPAGRFEFPHMAAIGFDPSDTGEIEWICGGTILSKQYILTAAHCLSHYEKGDAKWVKLGVTTLDDTNHRQEIKVAERIAYPQYRSSSHYHDIGLLKLEKNAKLNPYARPACLYQNLDISAEKAIATGWGQTSYGGIASNKLLKVTIDLFDHAFCNSSYKNQISRKLRSGIIDDIQVCAGSKTEEKDTCQGDSGGPLQIYHIGDEVKCMYDIIGVTSFGKACSGSPGVYARVSHYLKWIEDVVWP